MADPTNDGPIAAAVLPEQSRRPYLKMTSVRYAYALMMASSLAFATMSACSHALREQCDWRIIAIARAGIAFVLTGSLAIWLGVRFTWLRPGTLWVRSIVGSLGMLCTFFALTHLPIAHAITLLNTFPFWVALLTWPVLGQRPSLGVWIALFCGIGGVAMIEHPEALAGWNGEWVVLASVLSICGSFATSVVMLGLNRLRKLDALAIVVHFSAIATLTTIGYSIATVCMGQSIDFSSLREAWVLLMLAGVGGFASIGQICMTRAFAVGPPERLAVLGLLQVVFTLGYDLAFWGHAADVQTIGGIALVVVPAAWLVARRHQAARAHDTLAPAAIA